MSSVPARARPGTVSAALARDKLGIPSVLFFLLSGIAPLTVAAGVITSAYATTGLTAIPAAFLVIAVVLGVFSAGYCAMARHITHAGALYAFVSRGLGRDAGVAAALVALLAYTMLQVGLYGAFGPALQAELQVSFLHIDPPWWACALAGWAVVTVLGLLSIDIATKVLGVLTSVEVIVVIAEIISGLTRPAGGRLSFTALSPSSLGSQGWSTAGVLAVIAILGFVGFEEAPVLAEESRSPRRTVPAATYTALGAIAVVYAGAAWAMSASAGQGHVVAAAASSGPGLLFGLSRTLAPAAQFLFMTSLFAALLSFHNTVWRYTFALAREGVLPGFLARTGTNSVPWRASLAQSLTGLAVIVIYASGGWAPMTDLFFWMGTSGGLGVLILLAATSVAVICFFRRTRRDEARQARAAGRPPAPAQDSVWSRLTAPLLAAVVLTVIIVLAIWKYATLLGVPPGSVAALLLPASFAVAALAGWLWATVLRVTRPQVHAAIGLGAHTGTGQATRSTTGAW
jgi:amino acid transporter